LGRRGLEMMLQLVPSQCSIRVLMELPTFCEPTAQTSLLAVAATSANDPPLERVGVGTALHVVPSKCTANGCCVPLDVEEPTAQMSLSAIAVVAENAELANCATT
jgi:hypothetical protein